MLALSSGPSQAVLHRPAAQNAASSPCPTPSSRLSKVQRLCAQELRPLRLAQRRFVPLVSCSALVDRLQEPDLHSKDLGWPRGFPSRYTLGEQLGRGSFGIVYLAVDRLSGQEVAAKIIQKDRKGTTREHILDKIQQEVCSCLCVALQCLALLTIENENMLADTQLVTQVDILRRMQGKDEALKLIAVFEVHFMFRFLILLLVVSKPATVYAIIIRDANVTSGSLYAG